MFVGGVLSLDTLEWLVFGGAFKNTMVVNLAIDPHLEHGVIDAYMILACIPAGGGREGARRSKKYGVLKWGMT